MSLADVTSARSSPGPDACPECDTSASVTSDLHKYQVACTCKVGSVSVQYACADEPGPPAPSKTDTPPALPPRPPHNRIVRRNNASTTQQPAGTNSDPSSCRRHRYAWWCVGCGALAAALGGLLAAQHILLRAYTASPQHLETVPAAVPAAMLVLTGICIMSLARRRNRYSYMIKVVGACCLVCALTCVLVTITTTVIHMNKLQTLKFCEFTMLTRTCTCYSMPPDLPQSSDEEGVRCVFEGVNGCGVVHGALYWCLRGVFALSVTAGLVCIFSSMLAYQLLSHERKKMYWEQLELRCRSLYRPPAGQSNNTLGRAPQTTCSCCTQCHPAQPSWDISLQHRFWAAGRIGNLYSPNPGTVRKTSAWSWFPWPRSNSQNSRSCHLGGIPQSGDSAYGFCDSDTPQANPNPSSHSYEERYHATFNRAQTMSNFATRSAGHFVPTQTLSQVGLSQVGLSEVGLGQNVVFGESSGSFDAQTGVWGPPPPYSPQGRGASRHHLHQDPASATLLHHHHIDQRSSIHHDQAHSIPNSHTCRNSQYFTHCQLSDPRINPDARIMQTELIRLNPELAQINPNLSQINPNLSQINPNLSQINPNLTQINPDLVRINQVYPGNVKELARLQEELARLGSESRFNTLRGHLVAYPTCQRSLGMSLGNLHQDCRGGNEGMAIECMHQKSNCKEQRTEISQKQGKENMAFQNEKNSPRRSGQDCHRNAESEVYFADVSSCCNVSLKAECCMKPNTNTSALVGTIENHPESTSESETGSFTLTRSQKPQPQAVTSKRRPRQNTDKTTARNHEKLRQELNNSIKMAEHQIQQLSNSMCQRLNEARLGEHLRMAALNDSRLSDSIEGRMSDSRNSERMSDARINDSRMSDVRMNDSRMSDARMNDSRMSDARMNDSRMSDARINDSRMSDARMNDSRSSECRINDSRLNDGRNESCLNEMRMHEYHNNSFSERINLPEERRNSDLSRPDISRPDISRPDISRPDISRSDISRPDIDVSSPKTKNLAALHLVKNSPKNVGKRQSPQHLKQSSSDSNTSNKDSFLQATGLSPLTPNTEVSLLSEDDERQDAFRDGVKKCESEMFEREKREEGVEKKVGHIHCYSDTNTMDSGWQSGSEKHITD